MALVGYAIVAVLGLTILFQIGKMIYDVIYLILSYLIPEKLHGLLLIKGLKPKYLVPLENYFSYYQQLLPHQKKIFEKRVQKFIDLKDFIPRQMPEVTDEMNALISASAIQLTFGIPGVYFSHFHRILVYPDDYYSTINQKYHKGEVNMKGIIVLSWKSFVQGDFNKDDGRNLGLHEMTHALRLENAILNLEYDYLDGDLLKSWHEASYEEIEGAADDEVRFFRDYAKANQQEFFAVAVDNFFERPLEFSSLKPHLYELLVKLLNQDPLKIGKVGWRH